MLGLIILFNSFSKAQSQKPTSKWKTYAKIMNVQMRTECWPFNSKMKVDVSFILQGVTS